MRLSEKYKPMTLSDIVGQPTMTFRWLVKRPRRVCYLIESAPGTGRSCTAHAVAHDLGCSLFSKHVLKASALNKDAIAELFGHTLRCVAHGPCSDACGHHRGVRALRQC